MTKFLFVTLFFICITHQFLNAQVTIKGSVIDNYNGKPIEDVSVQIYRTNFFQKTNFNGEFLFISSELADNQFITLTKDGYHHEVIPAKKSLGNLRTLDSIKLKPTRKELKRRKKEDKETKKKEKKAINKKKEENKKAEITLKAVNDSIKKAIKKEKKEAKKIDKTPANENYNIVEGEYELEQERLLILKQRYAKLIETTPETITNTKLYEFIDEWIGKPYDLGGTTKNGIDCSALTQKIYEQVYDIKIERDSNSQFYSRKTYRKKPISKNLHEGDLVFFGSSIRKISHIGVYLKNGYFVHATSNNGNQGSGVKINNLVKEPFWKRKFVAAGRRTN